MQTSSVTWLVIAGWVITIGNAIIPVVPTFWAALLGSVVAIATVLVHSQQVKTGKVGKAF